MAVRSKICPHCNTALLYDDGLKLTPRMREIYEFIRKNQPCSSDQVARHIFRNHADGGPTCASNIVTQCIRQMNVELTKRLKCRVVSRRGAGAMYEIHSTEMVRRKVMA